MNVYRCWHDGIKGYSCRVRDRNWMFVPDLGQPNNCVHRNLGLTELDFMNRFEKEYEMRCEALNHGGLRGFFRNLVSRNREPVTVYGRLLLS